MSEAAGSESIPVKPLKIAILGSAASVHLAPYADPSWTIWGCSPGAAAVAKRVDQWFEIHPLSQPDITADYLKWLANIDVPVALIRPDPRIPKGFTYPYAEAIQEFGPYFFTSSIAWILAMAIMANPAEIGLWGVDMSATEEYGHQRPGCHFFIREALKRGIKVFVPDESDLANPPQPYGFVMDSPMYKKLMVRRQELVTRLTAAAAEYEDKRNLWNFLRGGLDDLDYIINTWVR